MNFLCRLEIIFSQKFEGTAPLSFIVEKSGTILILNLLYKTCFQFWLEALSFLCFRCPEISL